MRKTITAIACTAALLGWSAAAAANPPAHPAEHPEGDHTGTDHKDDAHKDDAHHDDAHKDGHHEGETHPKH